MERGPLPPGGEWPAGWEPAQLGGVVQSRSPVIPLSVNGANPVVYLGAQDGNVYAVNGAAGGAAAFPWGPTSIAGMVQAAPAGIFSAFGGGYNYLLVGTRDDGADNKLVALNPDTPGNVVGTFDNGGSPDGIGIITGMATVDYAARRVSSWGPHQSSPRPGPRTGRSAASSRARSS
jgi:outer membrane protein assembly factor BamB